MMLEIAKAESKGTPVSMTSISRGTEISKSYLEQLAIPLKASGLLHGRTGRAGGYTLAKPASEIRIREIVESTIGPIDLVECVGNPDHCMRSADCETRLVWTLIASRVRAMLDERYHVSFSDIEASVLPALRHRLLLNFEGQAEGVTTDHVLEQILESTPKALEQKLDVP